MVDHSPELFPGSHLLLQSKLPLKIGFQGKQLMLGSVKLELVRRRRLKMKRKTRRRLKMMRKRRRRLKMKRRGNSQL